MEEAINKIVIEHFGLSVFVFLVVIAGIVSASIMGYRLYLKAKKIDELPCDKHQEKIAMHDNAVTRIETAIKYLTKEIDNAISMFQRQNTRADGFTQAHSPLSITEQGWEMAERLGLGKMFDDNWPRIKALIDDGVPDKNAYDIDDFCIKTAVVFPEKFLSGENIAVLKDDAFKKGNTLASYMKVVAVMARDRYFKENGMENMMESEKASD